MISDILINVMSISYRNGSLTDLNSEVVGGNERS